MHGKVTLFSCINLAIGVFFARKGLCATPGCHPGTISSNPKNA